MNKNSTPTLEDVARGAGVSTATVSRCLNAPEKVEETTRKRVLSVVQKLGYFPNFGAQVLAAKRTNTIGAVIPTMENAVFAKGIQAFQEELGRHGYTLLISSSSYQEDLEAEQIRTLISRGADGLLLIGHHRKQEIYQFLRRQSIPVLTSWIYDIDNEIPSVGFDNKLAMKELAKEVIKYGHRNIAAITASQTTNDRARARVAGISEAMIEEGLNPDNLNVIEVPYGIESGSEAFAKLANSRNRPSVIMCGNDVLAAGALCQARRMGLRVPEDISITGFDDIELATVVDPAITTVHVPHREMGREAAQLLISMMKGTNAPKSVRLATHLCMRGSLGSIG